MKHENTPLPADAKPKMLFNSDGFEFLLKALAVLFKIMGMLLVVALNIVAALCETGSNNRVKSKYVSLNPMKTESENKFDGTGYYKIVREKKS
ncbi:hypothetical protein RHO12_01835 [Orbus sturtevantii]|uniref:hypothetical protein n=1 Tax=Orbus sturtevantii TaxID=3074109 RepID=UPI00370D2AAE